MAEVVAATPVPAAPVAPAPAAPAPVATPTPAAPVTPSPAVAEAPAALTPAPPSDVGAAPSPEAPKPPTTIIGEALAKPAEKPADAKPPEATKPTEETKAPEAQSDEPASPPAYDAFQLPEGVTFTEERVGGFTKLLGEFEVASKADHAAVQQLGQSLVNYYIDETNKTLQAVQDGYARAWNDTKEEWKQTFLKDPEFGGNRADTTVNSALTFIRTHGGTPEQVAEIQSILDSSGLGNHPAMIRLFAKAGSAMSEGKPLAATTPPPAPKSKTQTLYGGKSR